MNSVPTCLTTLFSTIALSAGVASTEPTPASPSSPAAQPTGVGPRIQFATNTYDYGRQITGTLINYTFIFTNAGDQVLEVPIAQGSCHCTTAGEWTKLVEPGKTGTIPVTFNSSGFSGQINRTVTVSCNDKTQPTVLLQLVGTVWKPIEVSPQMAYMTVTEDAPAAPPTTVRIVSNLDEPFTLFPPESNNPAFTAVLKTNEPGKQYELLVNAVPPFSPGTVQGQILLKTSSSNTPIISVSAMVNVQPAVTLIPGQINLPAAPLETPVSTTLAINNNGTNTLKLTEPTIGALGVDIDIKEGQPGRLFTVTINFPRGFEPSFGLPLEFSVKSSNPKYALLKAPVTFAPKVVTPGAPTAQFPVSTQPTAPH